ncbi:MAG: HAD family hydrolase [bacterium]
MTHRHWVFDMDGTLTLAAHDFEAIRRELGLPSGAPIVRTLNALPAEQAAPLRAKLQEIEEDLARQARPAPGVYELLEALRERGCQMGILTLNSRENAWITLKCLGLDAYFAPGTVLGRWCLPNPKPAPDGVRHLLESWDASTRDAVMVGDYRWDLETGRAAGVTTIHVDLSGTHPWPELADHCFSSLGQLRESLSSTHERSRARKLCKK